MISWKGSLSEEALKYRLKSIVDATRYGQTGYFGLNDDDSVIVTHPINPALNNKICMNIKTKVESKYLKSFSDVAKKRWWRLCWLCMA